MFPDDTDSEFWSTGGTPVGTWNEDMTSNVPGDRRGLGSSGPFTLTPNQVETITFAYLFAQDYSGSGNRTAIDILLDRSEHISDLVEQNITCSSLPVGIDDVEEIDFTIFPNPSSSIVHINSEFSIEEIQILNLSGQQMPIKRINSDKLDVSNLATGIYFIKVKSEGRETVRKFMKS